MKLADKIQLKLMEWCRGHAYDIIIPNYYFGFYEMDLFRLLDSGYSVEYEIKVSRSDFKADFKKSFKTYSGLKSDKHYDLANGKRVCNRFFFVVPANLVKVEEIPDHCGLIYYHADGRMEVIKNAKMLHKRKITEMRNMSHKLSIRCEILRAKLNYARFELKEANLLLKKFESQIV